MQINADVLAFNIAVFISTLFLLEFGADKFIDHTAIVARRTGISQTLIGLVTAGGEWEELAVVVASLAQGRPALAIGNTIGSTISNILGAFSLGLIFQDTNKDIQFDNSSRIYSALLLIVTTFATPVLYFSRKTIWLVCGSILLTSFVIYVGSVGWAISRGRLTAPEDPESDDDADNSVEIESAHRAQDVLSQEDAKSGGHSTKDSTSTSLKYHIFYLFIGLLAITLAGYILSHAATTIVDEFHISSVLFGVTILAISTTLPEKFIAVMSGRRGHMGILVATTAGSNIFLLTLCCGIVMVSGSSGKFNGDNVSIPELAVMWGSTLAFTLTVWFGPGRFSRWIGVAMLLSYITFIVLDFTVIHSVVRDT
ncbi:Sodium/calcium exchanger protein-domain-containing protein [Amanita rubescens]|nr:Sodium/calcium exchanger protein-domain-containing protein [Amanita rubescens]